MEKLKQSEESAVQSDSTEANISDLELASLDMQPADVSEASSEEPLLSMEYTQENLKPVLEAILFSSEKAMSVKSIAQVFEQYATAPSDDLIIDTLNAIQEAFCGRGVELIEVASGYRFQVPEAVMPWVRQLNKEKPQRYSRALLETLALIAYRQPITRGEIEDIRGVAVSSHIIKTLQEREWIRVVGHKDVPGRPALLATTPAFLNYFNLTSLQELPALTDIKNLENEEAAVDVDISIEDAGGSAELDAKEAGDIMREADGSSISSEDKVGHVSLPEPEAAEQQQDDDVVCESQASEAHESSSVEPVSFATLSEKFGPLDEEAASEVD